MWTQISSPVRGIQWYGEGSRGVSRGSSMPQCTHGLMERTYQQGYIYCYMNTVQLFLAYFLFGDGLQGFTRAGLDAGWAQDKPAVRTEQLNMIPLYSTQPLH